jgi:carbonic anhydrase/acetyltransferase-like protein (isoleucine patch superfamily)
VGYRKISGRKRIYKEKKVFVKRNGQSPNIHSSAVIAPTAQIVGNVSVGEGCYVDYNVVIESSGTPIEIGDHVIILANSVIRSIGGVSRPPFAVQISDHALISPLCALVGCQIGRNCYIATGAMIFQGAVIGDDSRISAGAIVHVQTALPPDSRVGLRHIAVPTPNGCLITPDIQAAREHLAAADFFGAVFQQGQQEQGALQSRVMEQLLQEMLGWHDEVSYDQAGER